MNQQDLFQVELSERLNWFIKLRWLAVIGVLLTVWLTSNFLNIIIYPFPLYIIAASIACYNSIFFFYSKKVNLLGESYNRVETNNVYANVQVLVDLITLTLLIHFSGGVENPFIFYCIFHMCISSILLSAKAAYLQMTFAIMLFGTIAGLEYAGLIPHFHLRGFLPENIYQELPYVLGVLFVFITTLYISVSMSTSVSGRLRKREDQLVALEESLEKANEKLRWQDRLKSEYVLRVTHELRSPLAAVQSCLQVVSAGFISGVSEKQREMIERASRRTDALITLINDLLELSRIKAHENVLPMESMNICTIIQKTIDFMRQLAEGKRISLQVTLPCGIDRIKESCSSQSLAVEKVDFPCSLGGIRANEESMVQLFNNLISNAIKYTDEGGNVSIEAKAEDGSLTIIVLDSGIGISRDDLPRIFEEFYRSENAKSLNKIGTGLGLSIVKQVVDSHKGKIWIESEVGKGTKFNLKLPRKI